MNIAEFIDAIALYGAEKVSWLLGLAPSEQTVNQIAGAIKAISTGFSAYAGYKAIRAWLYSGEHRRSAMSEVPALALAICTNFDRFLSQLGAIANVRQATAERHKEIISRPDIVTLSQGRVITDPAELEQVRKELLARDIKKWEQYHLDEAKRELSATLTAIRQLEDAIKDGKDQISLSGPVGTRILRDSQQLSDFMKVSVLGLNAVLLDFFPDLMDSKETITALAVFKPFDLSAFGARTVSLLKSCKFDQKFRRKIADSTDRFAVRNDAKKQASIYSDYKIWAKANDRSAVGDIDYKLI